MNEFLGYKSEDLIGKSVYEYHHAMDSDAICLAYKSCTYVYIHNFFCKNYINFFIFLLNQFPKKKIQSPQTFNTLNLNLI